MSSPAAVTEHGASLLDADPGLGRLLGGRAALDHGHRPLLPVLALPAGDWSPPPASVLGHGTLALFLLTGALLREPPSEHGRLLGPGDAVEPWSRPAARWTACTPVQAVIVGQAFLRALAPWPRALARLQRRARDEPRQAGLPLDRAGSASAEARLAELLWRLAARWGTTAGDGVALPLQLAPAMLAALTAVPELDAVAGLRALARTGVATRRADGTWLLRADPRRRDDGLADARDGLREHVGALFARTRAIQALSAELVEDAAAHVRRREQRGRQAAAEAAERSG